MRDFARDASPESPRDASAQAPSSSSRTLDLPGLSEHLRSTKRLVVLSLLEIAGEAAFTQVMTWSGLSRGNLTGYVSALEDAELLVQDKGHVGKKPRTVLKITDGGREALRLHRAALDRLPNSLARRIEEHPEPGSAGERGPG